MNGGAARPEGAAPAAARRSLLVRSLLYAWAGPVTLVGLGAALAVALSGGRVRVVDGVVEASGGLLSRLFPRMVPRLHLWAVTLGHVVLAEHAGSAERTRRHERVHVRQYEKWGLLFPLLYGASSARALLRGGDPYRDNAFEREAFAGEEERVAAAVAGRGEGAG